jgi:N-acetylglucosamine-6-phosphate deacetylase
MTGCGDAFGIDPSSGQSIRVEFADGVITAIAPGGTAQHFIAPGLIDLQVNGYAGHDLNSGTLEVATVEALGRALLAVGVTSFAPTLVTAGVASLLAALEVIARAREATPFLERMIGHVHVEGPWISPEDGARGAHDARHVRDIDLEEFDAWQAASGGLVGMVTLSPHWPGASDKIAALVARGVWVAIGHTTANPGQIAAAVAAGASVSTHLGNGMPALLPRHPNAIWSQLANDGLTASFIADGHHLDEDTLRAMLRAKGIERSFLVSDTAALGGMAPGRYASPIGGAVELTADGRLGMAGTPYLAGAALPLSACVARAISLAGLTLAQALDLATVQPARFMKGRGQLAVGMPADLLCFDWRPGDRQLHMRDVYLGGERVAGDDA